MITHDSPESKKQVEEIAAKLKAVLVPYIGQLNEAHVFPGIRRAVGSFLQKYESPPISPNDMSKWLIIGPGNDANTISIKLQHERMADNPDDVPDWVWAMFWSMNPNFKPTWKT